MTDLERINFIQLTLGIRLKRVDHADSWKKDFAILDTTEMSMDEVQGKSTIKMGARNYAVDQNGNVTALALDFAPTFLLPQNLLTGFERLKQLSLRHCGLSDFSFLKEMRHLAALDLSYCQLGIIPELRDLKGLTTLNLCFNRIKDLTPLRHLHGLASLDLSFNQLVDISALEMAENLRHLALMFCWRLDHSGLRNLKTWLRLTWKTIA